MASDLGYTNFDDASCSGASTLQLATAQDVGASGINPPQAEALNGSESLVTVSIGGNDAQYGNVVDSCLTPAYSESVPTATPCRDAFIVNGIDYLTPLAAAISNNVKQALALIRSRAPFAEIYAVGYPQLIPPDAAGCPGSLGVSVADAQLFDQWWRTVNSSIKFEAQAAGAHFVDNYTPSIGHSACSGANRWIEPRIDPINAAEMHPNARGLRAAADAIEGAIAVQEGSPAPGMTNPVPEMGQAADSIVLQLKRSRLRAARSGGPIMNKGTGGAKLTLIAARRGKVAFIFSRISGKNIRRIGEQMLVKVELGVNNFRITGRYKGRAFKPGHYQLKAQYVEASSSAAAALNFRVLR